jgi:hypothetical protein
MLYIPQLITNYLLLPSLPRESPDEPRENEPASVPRRAMIPPVSEPVNPLHATPLQGTHGHGHLNNINIFWFLIFC